MDGAIGSYLQSLKELHSDKSECNSFFISLLHKAYIDAGAKIVKTNTFNLGNIALRQANTSKELESKIIENIALASSVVKEHTDVLIFGVVGPLFYGDKDQRLSTYVDIVNTFVENGIETLYFETITSNVILREIIEALQKVRITNSLSINLSFTTKEDIPFKLISGDSLEETVELIKDIDTRRSSFAKEYSSSITKDTAQIDTCISTVAQGHSQSLIKNLIQIDTIGLNCISADRVDTIAQNLTFLKENISRPLSFSPSLGVPNSHGFYPISIKETIYNIEKLTSQIDLKIIGGCCGTHPSFIKWLNDIHFLNKNSDLYL